MKKKILFIVLDGLAGRPIKAFNNKTELQAASTPILDYLAEKGETGIVEVIPKVAPESDSAVISILGYPIKEYTGRGPLEAEGFNVDFKKGMLALRCNFATLKNNKLIDRRVGRTLTSKEAAQLAKTINKKVKLKAKFKFYPSVAHRAVLVIKNKRLSNKITNTDPAYKIIKGVPHAVHKFKMKVMKCKPLKKNAKFSAFLINDFIKKSHEVMENHIINKKRKKQKKLLANVVLCRDAGIKLPKLKSISKRFKRKWAILADMPLEIGIGRLADMKVINLPLPTFTKKDYSIRIKKTLSALKKFDCLYIHIKGPDLFGHDGNYKGKKKSIEDIDKYFLKPLLKKINLKNTIIVVTADHSTPCTIKAHSSDPVPILIAGDDIKADKVKRFNEKICKKGNIGKIKGTDIMKILEKL